jgi:hypothetical protein
MLPNIKKSHPKAAFISPVGREDSKSDLQHPMLARYRATLHPEALLCNVFGKSGSKYRISRIKSN